MVTFQQMPKKNQYSANTKLYTFWISRTASISNLQLQVSWLKLIKMGYIDIESVLKSKNLIYMSLTLLQKLQLSNLSVYTTSHDCHPGSRQNDLQPSCPNLLWTKTSVWNCYCIASRRAVLVIAIANLEIHVILLRCPLSTQVNFTN